MQNERLIKFLNENGFIEIDGSAKSPDWVLFRKDNIDVEITTHKDNY